VYGENAADQLWTEQEEAILALARETEWAEAYAVNNPGCPMGSIYLEFLRHEMIAAQEEN